MHGYYAGLWFAATTLEKCPYKTMFARTREATPSNCVLAISRDNIKLTLNAGSSVSDVPVNAINAEEENAATGEKRLLG